MAAILIILTIFVSDLLIKDYIEKNKELYKDEEILNGKIIITKYHNKGAFLNALEKNRKLLLTISGIFFGIIILLLSYLIPQKKNKLFIFVLQDRVDCKGAAERSF